MNSQAIQAAIEAAISVDFININTEDNIHFYVTVVSCEFQSLTKMQQHKRILDLFQQQIADNTIHAMSLKTYTPEKWATLSAEQSS